jgi:hypothetical protein
MESWAISYLINPTSHLIFSLLSTRAMVIAPLMKEKDLRYISTRTDTKRLVSSIIHESSPILPYWCTDLKFRPLSWFFTLPDRKPCYE